MYIAHNVLYNVQTQPYCKIQLYMEKAQGFEFVYFLLHSSGSVRVR